MPTSNRWAATLGLLVASLFFARSAWADTVYVAVGAGGNTGDLFTINPANGSMLSDIGPIVDSQGNGYAITGLAFQPGTGTLYAATSLQSPSGASSLQTSNYLVTIDTATALVTRVGQMFPSADGTAASDITFTSNGTLYAWGSAAHDMYSVNLATGATTLVGASGVGSGFGGGGLAANASDVVYSTPDSQTNPPGTLRTISTVDGHGTIVGTLTGLSSTPRNHTINALAFGSSGILYGLDSDRGVPAHTQLATIDTNTGAVTDLGPTLNSLDALAILTTVPEPSSLVLLACGAMMLVGGHRWLRRRKS